MSYHVKQNLFLILPTEAKSGDPQLGRKQTVRGPSAGHEVPPRDAAVSNPSDVLGTDMARTRKLRAAPLGRGSCTAVHRLPDIQFLPNSSYSVRYADTQLGTGAAPRDSKGEPRAPNEDLCRDTTVPKTAGKGMLRLGFKLKFGFQGL